MTNRRTKISPKNVRGLGHVTPTVFGSTVGYPSDSLASCFNLSGVKGRRSDRWRQRSWGWGLWLWWGDMRRMR